MISAQVNNNGYVESSASPKQFLGWEEEDFVRREIQTLNDFFYKNDINRIVDSHRRLDLTFHSLLPMQPDYRGEKINYADYLDRSTLYQVFAYEGKLYDMNGHPINTKPLDFDTGAMLIMTQRGVLFLSHKIRGQIHHSTFVGGEPVAYACMLEIRDGGMTKESSWSGHYQPGEEQAEQFSRRIRDNFCITYSKELTPIFLEGIWGQNPFKETVFEFPNTKCVLSGQPLLDPVRLPCNHAFNRKPLIEWLRKKKHCPLDLERYTESDISLDADIALRVQAQFPKIQKAISIFNKRLDEQVALFMDDDRDESLAKVETVFMREGVLLFMKRDCYLKRIATIAVKLGICKETKGKDSEYHFVINSMGIGGLSVLSDALDLTRRYNEGIPKVWIQPLKF